MTKKTAIDLITTSSAVTAGTMSLSLLPLDTDPLLQTAVALTQLLVALVQVCFALKTRAAGTLLGPACSAIAAAAVVVYGDLGWWFLPADVALLLLEVMRLVRWVRPGRRQGR